MRKLKLSILKIKDKSKMFMAFSSSTVAYENSTDIELIFAIVLFIAGVVTFLFGIFGSNTNGNYPKFFDDSDDWIERHYSARYSYYPGNIHNDLDELYK